jgi:hypothetical protein
MKNWFLFFKIILHFLEQNMRQNENQLIKSNLRKNQQSFVDNFSHHVLSHKHPSTVFRHILIERIGIIVEEFNLLNI